jgi:glycosyltransferase involved in cell wall biosynthesis
VNKAKLRVLVLGDSRSFHLERYIPELKRQDCEVLLASLEAGKIEHYQLQWRGPIRQLHYRRAAPELRTLIEKFQPQVVDAHYASGYGHLAATALHDLTIPLVVELWGSDILVVSKKSFLHKRKTVTALKSADAVVSDSQYLVDEAGKLAAPARTLVEPFGIERKYLELHKKDYALSRPLKIIVPRPHEKIYNNLFILHSLSELLKEKKISLTFPDFGSLIDEFRTEIDILNCPGVNLYKKCERDPFLKMMSEHDVYLSAALSDSSPVSLIESMALGLIPIAANIPGIQEWSQNDQALTFTKDRSAQLSTVIKNVTDSNSTYAQMRACNLELVKTKALFENNVAARINLMRQLVSLS